MSQHLGLVAFLRFHPIDCLALFWARVLLIDGPLFNLAQAGHPTPRALEAPLACHSCPQSGFEHFHQNLVALPASTLVAGSSFLDEYSNASDGWVVARLLVVLTKRPEQILQPLPCTRSEPVACHSCPHFEHFHHSFLPVPAMT